MQVRDPVRNSHIHFLAFIVLLPFVSAVSSYIGARDILLLVFVILGSFVFLAFRRSTSDDLDPLFVALTIAISVSLLLSVTSASDGLAGYDIHQEYSLFEQVSTSGRWNNQMQSVYNSVISISILPSIIAAVSGLDGTHVFEFVYPLMYSMVPVILYKTYRKLLSPAAAFLSVFLFMSYVTFYTEMVQLARQEIAELLFVLLLWIMLSSGVNRSFPGQLVVVLLAVGGVSAHYSLAYLFVSLLIFSFVLSKLSHKVASLATAGTVLFLTLLAFLWYLSVAGGAAFATLTRFISYLAQNFGQDFFNPSSRPLAVLQASGLVAGSSGLLHDFNRATQYLVQICLVSGLIVFAAKRQKTFAERQMFPVMVAALSLIICSVVVPFFAFSLELSRLYHIALLFASPCFVYGAEWIGSLPKWMSRHVHIDLEIPDVHFPRGRVLAAALLFSFFLFSSGWVWSVSLDRPTSLVLDRERMLAYPDATVTLAYYNWFTFPQDIAAARWLRPSLVNGSIVCADETARTHVLVSYGGLNFSHLTFAGGCNPSNSYVFLSTVNGLYGLASQEQNKPCPWCISNISEKLTVFHKDRIYSSGGASFYA